MRVNVSRILNASFFDCNCNKRLLYARISLSISLVLKFPAVYFNF
nr:MAG TPA: hypothetical protein [Caudoviricetes sp.]DAT68343.1 MAG TPA: hypothetical protein [Caudoviricetes sp.]